MTVNAVVPDHVHCSFIVYMFLALQNVLSITIILVDRSNCIQLLFQVLYLSRIYLAYVVMHCYIFIIKYNLKMRLLSMLDVCLSSCTVYH